MANRAIATLTDMEIFGVEERWDYPTTVGDCEDALLKRKQLNEMGYAWPLFCRLSPVMPKAVDTPC